MSTLLWLLAVVTPCGMSFAWRVSGASYHAGGYGDVFLQWTIWRQAMWLFRTPGLSESLSTQKPSNTSVLVSAWLLFTTFVCRETALSYDSQQRLHKRSPYSGLNKINSAFVVHLQARMSRTYGDMNECASVYITVNLLNDKITHLLIYEEKQPRRHKNNGE